MRFRILVLFLFAGLALCPTLARAQLKIFACVPEWAALAQELGGDKVSVTLAAGALQDPDKVEVTPQLLVKVREAALAVCTGPLEADWLPGVLRRAANVNVRIGTPGYFAAAGYVRMMAVPTSEAGGKEHAHSAGHPHIQTDPRNVRAVAVQLGRRMGQIDAANAAYYSERTQAFVTRLDAAIKRWEAQAAPLKGIKIISQHNNLDYLFAWLGIELVGTVEITSGQAPPPAHLSKIVDIATAQRIRLVANGVYEDQKSARFVADRAKVPLVSLAFTVGGNAASKDIISLFDDMIGQMLKAHRGGA